MDTQEKADRLRRVTEEEREFTLEVQRVNQEFSASYKALFS
ncbi:hypothetical protein ACPCXE_12925 [Bacillus velezensis]|nr:MULTISPECIES: hypothetical protein [Bacillus]EJD65866.1 hypothetical protein BB65665_19432 [Bacillus sp. 916]MEB3695411.1 hypothetical protein [Bacillus amyloliquefaciens]CDG29688.1 protein of unknown function [Bacillus velezensis UCMB5033]